MEKVKKALAYPPSITNLLLEKIISTQSNPIWRCVAPFKKPDNRVQALACSNPAGTAVDDFWSTNTVYDPGIRTPLQSKMNILWRFRTHPMFKELSGLYGDHTNDVILDYGCGPGNDIAGFITQSKAKKIIGMDVSQKR